MVLARLEADRLILDNTGFRDRDACHTVPGSKYKDGIWSAPVSWAAIKVARSLWPELETDVDLTAWAWGEYERRVRPAMEWRTVALDPANEAWCPVKGLYGYQQTGANWIQAAQGCTLADDMGTGKTVQTICALEIADAYPALIVCPSSAKINWQREYHQWAPNRTAVVVTGTATQRRRLIQCRADVYIVGFEALRTHTALGRYGSTRLTQTEKDSKELNNIDWATVIVDEAHRAVDPHAKQTRSIWGVSANATLRIALTGTPIVNSPDDLWALLHFEDPIEWPSKTKYLDRYCKLSFNRWGGMEVDGLNPYNREEFFSLIEPRLLRRPKSLVLPWLPPKVYERRDVAMYPKQRKAYDEFRTGSVAALDSGSSVAIDPLTVLTRLTQLASANGDITPQGDYRMCAPSPKVDALLELLADLGEAPLVVFAQSRQLIGLAAQALEKEGITYGLVQGEQTEYERQHAIDAFQDGRVQVILCTFGAGSEAITLTSAATLCFLQRSWSMVANRQAEDRVHRPGQNAAQVTIIDLVATGTVEEHILEVIENKGDMSEEVVRDKATLRRILGSV